VTQVLFPKPVLHLNIKVHRTERMTGLHKK